MIYTGYYGAVNKYLNIYPNFALVAISGKPPINWKYYHFKKFAPSYSIWKEYHDSTLPLNDKINKYTYRFNTEILNNLNKDTILLDLYNTVNQNQNLILLCYEKPNTFCHRHLIANYLLKEFNLNVTEITF